MKKLILFAVVTSFYFVSAQAQEVRFGVKGGINFSSMTTKGNTAFADISSRTAFHLGALAEIPFGESFSLQPEILYNSIGAKASFAEEINDVDYREEWHIKFGYLSVPIMAKYYLIEGFAIEAGPQISLLLSAKGDYKNNITGSIKDLNLKDFYKKIDFGVGVGASYRIDMGMFFSARYVIGVLDVFDNDSDADEDDVVTLRKNNVFQISVGYSF